MGYNGIAEGAVQKVLSAQRFKRTPLFSDGMIVATSIAIVVFRGV